MRWARPDKVVDHFPAGSCGCGLGLAGAVDLGVARSYQQQDVPEPRPAVRYQQMKRRHDLRSYRWDEESEQQLKPFFDSYEPPVWFEAQARLIAYASDPVLTAFEAREQAQHEVWARYQRYRMMADDNKRAAETGQIGAAHDGQETIDARRAVDAAVEEAEAQDQLLIKLIRDELRSLPEAARLSSAQTG